MVQVLSGVIAPQAVRELNPPAERTPSTYSGIKTPSMT